MVGASVGWVVAVGVGAVVGVAAAGAAVGNAMAMTWSGAVVGCAVAVGRGVLLGATVAVGRGVRVGRGMAVGRGVRVGVGVMVGSTPAWRRLLSIREAVNVPPQQSRSRVAMIGTARRRPRMVMGRRQPKSRRLSQCIRCSFDCACNIGRIGRFGRIGLGVVADDARFLGGEAFEQGEDEGLVVRGEAAPEGEDAVAGGGFVDDAAGAHFWRGMVG